MQVGEEAEERAALFGGVVADGAAEHGVVGFEGVEYGFYRDRGGDFEGELVRGDAGETEQVEWEFEADEGHKSRD